MKGTENIKYYNFVYRTINPAGIIDLSYRKKTIGAQNQEAAVQILRSTLVQDEVSNIRIDRIENSSVSKIPEKKKKRSILGWLAIGVLIAGFAASLLSKLF
tara:strand:+ start:217 stop:519 length:303 start_codon:yes stop_codon:yes gene_type:complete